MPNTKLPRKEAKTSARVLTSNENRKMLKEKKRKKKEALEKKEKKKNVPYKKEIGRKKKLNLRDLQAKDQKVIVLI